MINSLPAPRAGARSLTEVIPAALASLRGECDWLPPVTSAVVFVVDGLGMYNLAARAAHARFLSALRRKKHVARTVFPSTTAAALTSLLTGEMPGVHGVVGYRARIPASGRVVNQLKGWGDGGLDPYRWQRAVPLTARASRAGTRCFVVSRPQFEGSGFTMATLRGADLVSSADVRERALLAAHLAREHPGSLTYVYTPDVDAVAHKHGWQSERWAHALEEVDAAVADLAAALPASCGALITADHGLVDVPAHRHRLLHADDVRVRDVEAIGGEPRMLHLYTASGRAAAVRETWADMEGARSWVFSREEAIDAGLFGHVDADVRPRLGDVLVAARSTVAYYDDRGEDKAGQSMVGQHGSLTDEEVTVPLLRLGAYR